MIPRKQFLQAFSIVEVIVALGILTFGALAAYEQFVQSHRLGQRQFLRLQARNLARQELEQLRASPYPQLKAWTPPPLASVCPGHLRFVYQDEVTSRPDGLLALTVRVGWDMPTGGSFDPASSITVKGLKAP